jgi:hypothetical protein
VKPARSAQARSADESNKPTAATAPQSRRRKRRAVVRPEDPGQRVLLERPGPPPARRGLHSRLAGDMTAVPDSHNHAGPPEAASSTSVSLKRTATSSPSTISTSATTFSERPWRWMKLNVGIGLCLPSLTDGEARGLRRPERAQGGTERAGVTAAGSPKDLARPRSGVGEWALSERLWRGQRGVVVREGRTAWPRLGQRSQRPESQRPGRRLRITTAGCAARGSSKVPAMPTWWGSRVLTAAARTPMGGAGRRPLAECMLQVQDRRKPGQPDTRRRA